MKKLSLKQMESFQASNAGDGFCAGFAAAAAVYQVGVWANIWNPVGQGAAIAGGVIGVGCAIYALR